MVFEDQGPYVQVRDVVLPIEHTNDGLCVWKCKTINQATLIWEKRTRGRRNSKSKGTQSSGKTLTAVRESRDKEVLCKERRPNERPVPMMAAQERHASTAKERALEDIARSRRL